MGLSQTTWSQQGHENPHIAAKCLPSPVLNGKESDPGKKPQRGQQEETLQQAPKGWRQSVSGKGLQGP